MHAPTLLCGTSCWAADCATNRRPVPERLTLFAGTSFDSFPARLTFRPCRDALVTKTPPAARLDRPRSMWRTPEPWLLVLFGLAIYATRIDALTLRGEEPRRALVAYEMATSGNWFVPTQQGRLFPDRPPLGAWLMALSATICGDWTPAAIRWPTILGVVATSLVLFAYCRRFLTRLGALAAGGIFLTFGQVLQIGRFAECEGLFIFWMASALLGWHAAYADGRRAWRAWLVGYGFAALAGLHKGPQGPIYFAAAVGLNLLVRRDWRFAFSRAHAAGITLFAAIFGCWLVPYFLHTDLTAARNILFHLVAQRIGDDGSLLAHVASFPLEILGCLLPWSLLLVAYGAKSFRAQLGTSREAAIFAAAAVVATFPSVWFAFGAVGRHYMSLYPAFAVLTAIVVDRGLAASSAANIAAGWWKHGSRMAAGVVIAAVAAMLAAQIPGVVAKLPQSWGPRLVQPVGFTALYVVACCAAAAILMKTSRAATPIARARGVAAVAVFLGLSYSGCVVNALAAVSEDTAARVAAAKQQLPQGAKLVSVGELDPLFVFHYREPIEFREVAPSSREIAPGECFAFNAPVEGDWLPFDWELLTVVSCERNRKADPLRVVYVGRRTSVELADTPRLRR